MRELWSKLLGLRGRRERSSDLEEEMRAHLQLLADAHQEQGVSAGQARIAAAREFGNLTLTRERAAEAWQFPTLESILQDVRYGLRAMRRSPGFSAVIILTLALGIGANAAIFSVVYSVLLRPLPFPSGERLVSLAESTKKEPGFSVSWLNLRHWRDENHSFEDMAGFTHSDYTLTGYGNALLTHGVLVTSNFLRLTGATPLQGRLLSQSDDRPGSPSVVLLSPDFWMKNLGANPRVVGSTLVLNGKPYEVIGVLRPATSFFTRPPDFYLPLGPTASLSTKRSQHMSIRALGLLKPGVSLATARADLDGIMRRLASVDPGPEDDHRAWAQFLTEDRTGNVRATLLILMGAAGLVLLIACANVASLLLVRSTARAREMAIRGAIGAGTTRITRQLITETLVTAALGGCAGLLLAKVALTVLRYAAPANIPRLSEAAIDPQVLIFSILLTAFAGLVAGLAPVHNARHADLNSALKEGSATADSSRKRQALRSGLAIAEIAITVILAFASILLLRSLIAAQNGNPGFDAARVLALELQLPPQAYPSDEQVRQFYAALTADLRTQAHVDSVGSVMCPPSTGDCWDWWYSIPGKPAPPRDSVPLSLFNVVDNSYLSTMRMHLVAGRAFKDDDRPNGGKVALINEEVARKWWTSPRAAVGQQLKYGGPYLEGPTYEIAGVVANSKQMGLDTVAMPEIYVPFSQKPSRAMVVMIRTSGDPAALIPTVRRRVAALDPNLPVQSLRTFEAWLGNTLARRRFSTLLLGVFAILAVVLAATGIYGVLNDWVAIRQKEIAIRLAIGASRPRILGWVAAHALRLAAAGCVLGGLGCWAVSHWIESLLFEVAAGDPRVLVAATGGVIALAMVAAAGPLWRAIHVEAAGTLRAA